MNQKVQRSKVSHERWLVSYADFITLLFAFFVVLYAFSKADQKKPAQISAAIDSAFQSLSIVSAMPGSQSNIGKKELPASTGTRYPAEQATSAAQAQTDLDHIRHDLERRLSIQIAQRTVSIRLGRDGLVISLREAGFFDPGAATPRPETASALHQIAYSLADSHYDVRVEGHTDTTPIHNSKFDSNWELSSARATHIARMLLQMRALPPEQISAAGYAEYHPIATNDTADGRAENRRVDLVVMPRVVLDISSHDNSEDKSVWRKIADH